MIQLSYTHPMGPFTFSLLTKVVTQCTLICKADSTFTIPRVLLVVACTIVGTVFSVSHNSHPERMLGQTMVTLVCTSKERVRVDMIIRPAAAAKQVRHGAMRYHYSGEVR